MSHVPFTTLLNKIIQQRGDPPLIYEILIEQTNNNECLFHVNLQYKNYIIMNSGKDKENVKQKVAQNLYNALINESKETNQNVQPNSISKNCKKLNEICTQNKFEYPKYTVLRIKTSSKDSTYIAICFINNIKQIGIANSIKTAKDFAAIKVINSLSHKDEKCELRLINSLEHLHVTIQESSINDPKPSTSSQITKPITSNNNRDKNTNSYKMKTNNNHTASSFSTKSFKKCFKCGYRPPNQYNKF